MEKQRQYGYIPDVQTEKDFVFGSSSIPQDILQPDGNWREYLPVKELQAPYGFETYACTVFSILTCVEILIKRRYGIEKNYSDRFLAVASGTKNPGNSPRTVADFLRKIGVVPQDAWPYTPEVNSWDKWATTLPKELYDLAKDFTDEFDFRYAIVPPYQGDISKALMMSPLMISFYAWRPENGKYIRPRGMTDNHAVAMFDETEGDYREIFDSYDSPNIKKLEWKDEPQYAMRFWVQKKTEVEERKSVIWQTIMSILKLIGIMGKKGEALVVPTPTPEPVVEKVRITQMADAIKIFEGFFPPSKDHPGGSVSWKSNNPGNLKGTDGKFLKFVTYEQGYFALCDYIKRVGQGKHKAYPKDCDIRKFFSIYAPVGDSNHPTDYADFVAKRMKVGLDYKIKDLS